MRSERLISMHNKNIVFVSGHFCKLRCCEEEKHQVTANLMEKHPKVFFCHPKVFFFQVLGLKVRTSNYCGMKP